MINTTKTVLLLGLGLLVSACAGTDLPTRNTPFEETPTSTVTTPEGYQPAAPDRSSNPTVAGATPLVAGQIPVSVKSVHVQVPKSLTVSEANSYLPRQDIVWREDPLGDRHAQVQVIFQDAMAKGVASLNGPVNVNLDIQVTRFHALTEKARYTTGGVHSLWFNLTITDANTGKILVPTRSIRADLAAFGGAHALAAMARGQTQKVRISDHLAEVIRQELSNPEGYNHASLGFYQMLNNI